MASVQFLTRLPTHRLVLPNGLTVLVREDHSAPVVAVVTHVRAGYFDEPDAMVGISHVLEHMYFKGTERRGVGEIARETKAAGGYLNAGTIYDHTSYYTVLPAASLEPALDLQADALQHSAIDPDELRRELQVIIQEVKRKLDTPGAVAQETLFETMFDAHRIRRWRIGTEAVLSGFTRDDVLRYYRDLYHAGNTIVVIAGDVNAERAFELAQRHYAAMPAGQPVDGRGPDEPPASGFRFREISGDIVHTWLEWGWRTPGTLHPDTAALDVLALILGQGRASRLYRHVRDAGLVNSISASNYTPTQLGVFGISAELRPERTTAALQSIGAVLRTMLRDGIAGHEVQRAHNVLEARTIRRLETADGQARLLAEWEALGGWELGEEYMQRLLSTSAAELERVAREYLQPEQATLLCYRPAAAPALAAAAVPALLASPGGERAGAGAPPRESCPAAPYAPLTPWLEEDGVRCYATPWGARIAILPRSSTPLVSIAAAYTSGVLEETDDNAGITTLMARASVKGTLRRTAAQLAEDSEALGMSITPNVSADGFQWRLTVPSRHTSRGLELLAEAALQPAFAQMEVLRERSLALADLEQLRDDMYQYPLRLVLDRGFAGHPYGNGLTSIARALASLDEERVREWHARNVLQRAPWFFVVGDVADADALAGEISARFARAAGPPASLAPAPASWSGGAQEVVEERDKAQTAIVLGYPGPRRDHPDLHALRVLSNAISGLGGRLFEELRSRRSLAYAVAAYPIARWQGGSYVGYIGTSPEREEEARTELQRELQRCAELVIDDAEIDRSKRYTVGAWQIRRQTNARQLEDLADAILYGNGMSELREYEERVRAVTGEQVRAAAAKWLDPQRLVTGVVRGKPARSAGG